MTRPEKLRLWAANRQRLHLPAQLLLDSADEIERLRARVKELEREPQSHREDRWREKCEAAERERDEWKAKYEARVEAWPTDTEFYGR